MTIPCFLKLYGVTKIDYLQPIPLPNLDLKGLLYILTIRVLFPFFFYQFFAALK